MDSMRGLLSGSDERLEGAMEPPPVIGVDERRMQVRAYNFWASMLGERAYPSVEDLDIQEIEDFGPHSVLLDFTAGIEDPAIAFLGDRLRAESELDDDVQYISQVPSRSVLSRLTDHYLQIIANRAPIGFEAEFVNERDVTIMYRGILLPFSSDDDTIDFIMGVINWKEAVASPQADELLLEVEQSLRGPASAPLNAQVPVWADGPDSENLDEEDESIPGFADYDRQASPSLAASLGRPRHDVTMDEDFSALSEEYSVDQPADLPVDLPSSEPIDLDLALGLVSDLDAEAELADWLALARETAVAALAADSRSRNALYGAVARCYDFVLAAETQPEALADLLEDAGLKAQERAPMTPVVKLVFGAAYDKTRVAEYACVLGHARETGIGRGELTAYLDAYPGGLKALVRDERARKRGDAPAREAQGSAGEDALRAMSPVITLNLEGDDEFVVLIARRIDADNVGLVAAASPDAATWRKLAAKAQSLG